MNDAQVIAVMGAIIWASRSANSPEECLATAKKMMLHSNANMDFSGEEGGG